MFVVIPSSPVIPLTRLADSGIIATTVLMLQWQIRRSPCGLLGGVAKNRPRRSVTPVSAFGISYDLGAISSTAGCLSTTVKG
jgi:hypothetical protein